MRKSLSLAALMGVAVFVPAACSKNPEVPSVSFDAGTSLDSGAPSALPASSASASAAPPASASAPASSASANLGASFDAALDAALLVQAAKAAPGMTSDAPAGHETLVEGGHFGMVVTLQPGKCYTIIALSAPLQVSELDVHLYMMPLSIEAGHSPPTDKNPAVLGRGAQKTCPISPIPVPYKVDVTARKGAGRIAVGVFSKSK